MNRCDDLGRYLYLLSSRAHLLDEMLLPRQGSFEENAGRAAQRGKSKPPLVVGIADLKRDAEECLGWWCGQVVSVRPECGPTPHVRDIARRAQWLAGNVEVIAGLPFAELLADEVIAVAIQVVDFVDPPAAASDPGPPAEGTARQISRWTKHLGKPVSRSTIQRLVRTGVVPAVVGDDGQVIVRLDDVLAHWRPAV